MIEDRLLVAIAMALLGFGLVSRRAERGIVSPPMVFVVLGLGLGDWGLGWIELSTEGGFVEHLGEFALMLVLFADASRIDLHGLRAEASLPARLLGIGLPLTLAAGVGLALLLLPGFTFWEAMLLSAILAPTDAALGQAVVSSPLVPQRMRQTLNVESGLNDGIALPVVLLAAAFAVASAEADSAAGWAHFAALQIGLGPVVGAAVGYLGGQLVLRATRVSAMSLPFESLSALALAVLSFAAAELVGGNGFIATFVCGLVLGNTAAEICECIHDFAEAEGQLLTLLVFLLFGAVIVPDVVTGLEPALIGYALASLTVLRMLPVAVSLSGARLQWSSIAFLGWFGPRGLASILYMLIIVDETSLASRGTIESIVAITVLASVFAHGITAHPLAAAYGVAIERMRGAGDEAVPERASVPDNPVRVRFGDDPHSPIEAARRSPRRPGFRS